MYSVCSANALATLLRSVRQILSRILRDTTPARLRLVGFQANRRLLQVQRISHVTEEAFQKINRPVQVTSERASALRLADPKVQALWRALLLFQLLSTGFSSRHLRQHFASLLGQPPDSLTQGQMTYHLRRLRLHESIERIPQTHRYRITDLGLATAWFRSRTYSRILRPGLGAVLPQLSPPNSSLRRSFDKLDQEVTSWIHLDPSRKISRLKLDSFTSTFGLQDL
jgi:hypothetical protein